MKKLLEILVLGLWLSGNAYALDTPMKKLSKYFKKGGIFKKPFLKFFTENLLN